MNLDRTFPRRGLVFCSVPRGISKNRAAWPGKRGLVEFGVRMALSNNLALRQSQSMVLTPQLLQAINLLQMPNAELAAFIEGELERNPLREGAGEWGAEPHGEPAPPEPVVEIIEPG